MNASGRNKLFMSIGLTLFILILLVTFYKTDSASGGYSLLVGGIIIIFAVVAVVANLIKVKNTEQRVSALPKPYRNVFIDASELVGTSMMTKSAKQETMSMILEIFEHAHLENRTVEDVIGGDLGSFMKGFIESSGGQNSLLYTFSFSTLLYVIYLFIMKFYIVLRHGPFTMERIRTETLDMGLIVIYGLIAYLFFPWLYYTLQQAAKGRWQGGKRLLILLPFILPFGLFAALNKFETPVLRTFMDHPVPIFNSVFEIIIGLGILIVSYLLMKYAQRIQLRKSVK